MKEFVKQNARVIIIREVKIIYVFNVLNNVLNVLIVQVTV